jgi:DNA-binding HxlR family transcriptional regulator
MRMPRKLSPEEAAVMIIRRRLRQMEEAKMANREPDEEDPERDEEVREQPGEAKKKPHKG